MTGWGIYLVGYRTILTTGLVKMFKVVKTLTMRTVPSDLSSNYITRPKHYDNGGIIRPLITTIAPSFTLS